MNKALALLAAAWLGYRVGKEAMREEFKEALKGDDEWAAAQREVARDQ